MATSRGTLEIGRAAITAEQAEAVLSGATRRLALAPAAVRRVNRARKALETLLARGKPIYGINTGFGRLSDVAIPPDQVDALQRNLILSHATGLGPTLSVPETKLTMVLRIHTLVRGNSGIRLDTIERLLRLFNRDVIPVVPEQGSVGASGDLAPLAHVALPLLGQGRVHHDGKQIPAARGLKIAGVKPVHLTAKEGLCLINGTQFSTAIAWKNIIDAGRLVRTADLAGAISLEALKGNPLPFSAALARLRPHPGHAAVAANVRALLRGSHIRDAERRQDHLQDAYSLRCMPQVHGAARDALGFASSMVHRETETSTDNPLIIPEGLKVISGGNFHGQAISVAMDTLAIALSTLGGISERRTERLLNPDSSRGLPAFLAREGGLHSGLMMTQVAAAALTAENKALAHPASIDSIPTSANQEDFVPMAPTAARKCREIARNVEAVLAIEILCACQGLDHLGGRRPGKGVAAAHRAVRRRVPTLGDDRILEGDIEAVRSMVADGTLLRAAEKACGRIR